MKIKDVLKEQNGSYILEKLFNKDKAWLFLNDNLEVPKEYFEIKKKIDSGYPIEYIFEEVYFYGDKFYIKEGVLIPRDDTEVVVERAIEVINEKCKVKSEKYKVLDCCTGSGVIAIEIAKHTNAKVIATDISDLALEVAKKNAKMHGVEIEFKKCDLFNESADLLVANPPYVENFWQKPNEYEPDIAFFGGEDGLDIVREIIKKALKFEIKHLILEIGYNQKKPLSEFLENFDCQYEFFKDLGGRVRGVEILFS